MKITDQNNLTQREALLNECKGNLFEFLVAQGLSRKYKKEDKFLLTLSRDFKNRLRIYEETIRSSDENLLLSLPTLANSVVADILKLPLFVKSKNLFEFMVIGKMVATNDNSTWNETDIVAIEELPNKETIKHFLSLKLTKDHSYTNTKSAGVKSFLLKYFSVFHEANTFQGMLNQEVDESFHSMGHNLYSMVDLEFAGTFDNRWTLTELPGELNPDMRSVVHANYYRVALKLHGLLEQLKNKNEVQFRESLEALCGFGNKNIIQVHCFHQQAQLKEIVIKTYSDLFSNTENISLGELKKDGASFDVHFSRFHLQLRVKPMNKFTTAAYKINCSIKMDGKEDDK
jgi:hypothetical protein